MYLGVGGALAVRVDVELSVLNAVIVKVLLFLEPMKLQDQLLNERLGRAENTVKVWKRDLMAGSEYHHCREIKTNHNFYYFIIIFFLGQSVMAFHKMILYEFYRTDYFLNKASVGSRSVLHQHWSAEGSKGGDCLTNGQNMKFMLQDGC